MFLADVPVKTIVFATATYQTWQGLARVVVQATLDCTGPHRDAAKEIDVDAPPSAYATTCPTQDAVLRATSDDLTLSSTIRALT